MAEEVNLKQVETLEKLQGKVREFKFQVFLGTFLSVLNLVSTILMKFRVQDIVVTAILIGVTIWIRSKLKVALFNQKMYEQKIARGEIK